MTTLVRLLGRPQIVQDGVAVGGPRGHKAWGLLAFLALAERPPSRQRLVSMLFEHAEDPRGALRWNLAEMRRALGGRVSVGRDPLTLATDHDVSIDIMGLTAPGPADVLHGELLEGLSFDDSPAFDTWLGVERRRLAADCRALAYRRSVELLTGGQPAAAALIAVQALESDRLNDDLHAVLVSSLTRSGDRAAASAHLARCADLYRRELGAEVPAAVAAAATWAPAEPAVSAAAVRSLLDLADSSLSAGSVATGISQLRRAVAGVADTDQQLSGRARLALASALIHADGGRGGDVTTLLHQALAHARRGGDPATGAAACRELAFLAVQAGHRSEVEHWLGLAEAWCPTEAEAARILGVRGMSLSDAGAYDDALTVLGASTDAARRCGNRRQLAWSQAMIGRVRLLRGEAAQAAHVLDEALGHIRAERWTAFTPFPQALRAEAAVAVGDAATAHELLDYAWVQTVESGDQCWVAVVAHAQATLALYEGRDALTWCRTGLAAAPWYLWPRARLIDLTARLTLGSREGAELLDELERVAGAGTMRELTVRALIHRSRVEGGQHLARARAMASDIANPVLAAELTP
ncbi:AfsR/SARP family transcriptional regulator [Catellatospora chokoriensis]|uniref:Bacterial transcriptional activator domain-containing protein n=1 Tax=Catellatospora chokoriensis TaxID=310353 RepID=A0A8J3NP62_9ACTN|nr:SARP family transcriptional regulator [Catellatospora chokoriensis]GIF87685.1 hypothetical protein Cch02nite_11290 [Catellatospora chokoriensis]